MPNGASTAHLFQPKLFAMFGEHYGAQQFKRDLSAGLTVAIVALPLSMAIAVASGVSPERGLYAAIVGGFLVSALSGSRYQIGGPAGAFIVLVAACRMEFGLSGLLTAVLCSGALLAVLGLLRVGSLIRHIPHAVTVGFTAGIAVTILASQIKDFTGLHLAGPEPGALLPKLAALFRSAPSFNPFALALAAGCVVVIQTVRRLWPKAPSMLIAVVGASLLVFLLKLPVETIHSRFGEIPSGLPKPALPNLSLAGMATLAPTILSFTLLGGIESLLSAKVADSMSGRVHRSNMELVGQGVANIFSSLFGGLCVTGTIARTATNIRAGAFSPVSGMIHALILLSFMFVAAKWVGLIPLCALSGILAGVCWDMVERKEIRRLILQPSQGAVLAVTFLGTVVKDLTVGIVSGCVLALVLFLIRRRTPGHEPT